MNLPKTPCSPNYNLSPAYENVVKVCLMQEKTRKEIFEALAEKEGKGVTHGVCDDHHQDFINYSNQ